MTDLEFDLTIAHAEISRLRAENRTLRNELCLKCGSYREAHRGACGGCRWRNSDER